MIGPFPDPITGQTIANQMILTGLMEKGHHVDFIDSDTEKKVNNLSGQGKFNIKKILKSLVPIGKGVKNIIFNKYDVVYITPAQSYIGFLKYVPFINVAKMMNTACYIHFHGGFVRKMYDELTKEKQQQIQGHFNKCDGVIVLGESLRKMFHGIVPDHKVFVCENGVQPEFIIKEDELEVKVKKLNTENTMNIIYLSNLMETKGILHLLKACIKLKEEKVNFHLHVAGMIESGIEKQVKECFEKLGENITYHGVVSGDKKRKMLLNAHIFALPTYYPNEGQPISILEAMTMGGAIVTTYQGGIGDIFKDKVNGRVCEAQNVDSIKDALLQCNNNLEQYIRNNYSSAIEKYSSENFVSRLYNIVSDKK